MYCNCLCIYIVKRDKLAGGRKLHFDLISEEVPQKGFPTSTIDLNQFSATGICNT